ncbi:MAG: NUDIX hydrolase [Bacillota bacterium]|nr:NUDIX hydrolase [Bacillota bacterium]
MEKLLSSSRIYQGRIVGLRVDTVSTDSGRVTTREVVERPDTVAVLALDDAANVLLVKQFRYAVGRETLEIPAGTVDADETPAQAALRELREETGYGASSLDFLLEYGPAIGYCTERMTVFFARGLVPAPLPGDEEHIRLARVPFDSIHDSIVQGRQPFGDAKSTLAVMLARARGLV